MNHWVARIACANWNFIQNKIATPFNNFNQHIFRLLELIRHRTTAWKNRIQPTANHVLQTLLCLLLFFSLFTLLLLVFFWLNPLLSMFFGCIPFVHSQMLFTFFFFFYLNSQKMHHVSCRNALSLWHDRKSFYKQQLKTRNWTIEAIWQTHSNNKEKKIKKKLYSRELLQHTLYLCECVFARYTWTERRGERKKCAAKKVHWMKQVSCVVHSVSERESELKTKIMKLWPHIADRFVIYKVEIRHFFAAAAAADAAAAPPPTTTTPPKQTWYMTQIVDFRECVSCEQLCCTFDIDCNYSPQLKFIVIDRMFNFHFFKRFFFSEPFFVAHFS